MDDLDFCSTRRLFKRITVKLDTLYNFLQLSTVSLHLHTYKVYNCNFHMETNLLESYIEVFDKTEQVKEKGRISVNIRDKTGHF